MEERSRQGTRVTLFGLCLNLLLAALKFTVGALARSISITADATNNLMDSLSSLTSLVCFRLSGRSADKEHPFGHGRYEYVAGVFVSLLVVFVGLSFLQSSAERIFSPEPVAFSLLSTVLLLCSIGVKVLMGAVYLRAGKRMASLAVRAAALDSFSDVAVTSVTLLAFLLSPVTSLPLDGIAGLIVAVFVIAGGLRMLAETLHPLLGKPAEPELIAGIMALANSYPQVLGVHDLLIHDYGPGHTIASLHAEMSDELSFEEAHRWVDDLETEAARCLDVELLVHADPVDTGDVRVQDLHLALKKILRDLDPALAYHDLRLMPQETGAVLSFDLVIPFGRQYDVTQIQETVKTQLTRLDSEYEVRMNTDRA